jgi:Fe-S-cluster containining protein
MVESLDLFRLAEHFDADTAEAAERYTETVTIAWGAPVLMLKTTEPDDACVFLKDNLCGIRLARPRACRLYPLSVGPDESLKTFLIFNVSGEQHHFTKGRWRRAQEWVDDNFRAVDRAYIKMEYRAIKECGKIMNRIPRGREDAVLFQMLHWRYFNFDTSQGFLTQYVHNMERLKQELEKLATK